MFLDRLVHPASSILHLPVRKYGAHVMIDSHAKPSLDFSGTAYSVFLQPGFFGLTLHAQCRGI
jgi:hypothetical protein